VSVDSLTHVGFLQRDGSLGLVGFLPHLSKGEHALAPWISMARWLALQFWFARILRLAFGFWISSRAWHALDRWIALILRHAIPSWISVAPLARSRILDFWSHMARFAGYHWISQTLRRAVVHRISSIFWLAGQHRVSRRSWLADHFRISHFPWRAFFFWSSKSVLARCVFLVFSFGMARFFYPEF
jgi:hypothetical protein